MKTIEINDTEFTINGSEISFESPATGEIEIISLDYRDGQKDFAALNVHYDIEKFALYLRESDMKTAREDCKKYYWGAENSTKL